MPSSNGLYLYFFFVASMINLTIPSTPGAEFAFVPELRKTPPCLYHHLLEKVLPVGVVRCIHAANFVKQPLVFFYSLLKLYFVSVQQWLVLHNSRKLKRFVTGGGIFY